ncbi:MAG: hypothetical protein K6347_01915, partial [Campylobacterales bacterium]
MNKKRTHYTAEFKTQVVLELLRADQILNQVVANLPFDPAQAVKEYQDQIEELKNKHAEYPKKAGQLPLERDFLEGKLVSSVLLNDRRQMIKTEHDLPIIRQCELLHITRSTYYYKPTPVSDRVS